MKNRLNLRLVGLAALLALSAAGLYIYREAGSVGVPNAQPADPRAVLSAEKILLGGRAARWEKVSVGEGSEASDIDVTGDQAALPANCSRQKAVNLAASFFTVFSSGDQQRLTRLFDESTFEQYTVGDRGQVGYFEATDLEGLSRYFSLRQSQQEHLRLLKVQVRQGSHADRVDLAYIATREASDLAGQRLVLVGRGTISCVTQKIVSWSEGDVVSPGEGSPDSP